MTELITGALAALALVAMVCVLVILGTLFGAFSGLIVGWLFEDTIMRTLRGFGVDTNFTMWQLGATLGFVGGFFKTTDINKKD